MALSGPAGVELKVASDVLQVQQGVEALQRNMLEQWERDFANASDFVNRKYSSDREEVQKTLNEAKKALSDLDDRKDELEKEITEFVEKAANVKIPNPPCPPYDKVCEKARDVRCRTQRGNLRASCQNMRMLLGLNSTKSRETDAQPHSRLLNRRPRSWLNSTGESRPYKGSSLQALLGLRSMVHAPR